MLREKMLHSKVVLGSSKASSGHVWIKYPYTIFCIPLRDGQFQRQHRTQKIALSVESIESCQLSLWQWRHTLNERRRLVLTGFMLSCPTQSSSQYLDACYGKVRQWGQRQLPQSFSQYMHTQHEEIHTDRNLYTTHMHPHKQVYYSSCEKL